MTWVQVEVKADGSGWVVSTFYDSVKLGSMECADKAIILKELDNRVSLIMGLAKGKILTCKQGRH